jgi:hypothetical protein
MYQPSTGVLAFNLGSSNLARQKKKAKKGKKAKVSASPSVPVEAHRTD